MKHTPSWTTVILLCLLLVAGAAVLVLTPRTVPFDECSPLYRQYAGHEDIEATFVKDYPVDDTTLVDVTLLHATTDSAWVELCQKTLPYNYPDSLKENVMHGKTVSQVVTSKNDIRKIVIPTDTTQCDLVFLSAKTKYLLVFHPENKAQVSTICDKITWYLLNLEVNQNNLENNQTPLP